jgi:hypothetical protein
MALALETDPALVVDEPLVEELSVEPPAPVEYRPDENVIIFSLPDDEGVFIDCSEAFVTVEGDLFLTDLEGCSAAGTLGPNGQSNHGQVVRAYVHALKDLEYDGPRGHLVRTAARYDFGKKDKEGGEAGASGIAETGDADGRARGKNKVKPGKGKP